MPKPQIIEGDIAPASKHTFVGDVRINGAIGAGAKITVSNGTLEVMGAVEKGSCLQVLRDKKDIKGAFNACSLHINGALADKVKLGAADDLRLRANAGDRLMAMASNIYAREVGSNAELTATKNIHIEAVGDNSRLTAGARLYITFAGLSADLRAGEIMGADPCKLPYQCPRNSRDTFLGRRTTHFMNGNHSVVRLKRWGY